MTYQTKGVNVSYSRLVDEVAVDGILGRTDVDSKLGRSPDSESTELFSDWIGQLYPPSDELQRHATPMVSTAGSGVQPGALSDNVTALRSATPSVRSGRPSPRWSTSRSSGLVTSLCRERNRPVPLNTEYGTLQMTHVASPVRSRATPATRPKTSLSHGILPANAFNGLSHIFGFGVTWSPQSTRIGDF